MSHLAICCPIPGPNGRLGIYESTTQYDAPCLATGKKIDGVQVHSLRNRLIHFACEHGRVYHFPLAHPLSSAGVDALFDACTSAIGRPYDWLGAFRARDLPLGWIARRLFGQPELSSLFCSEFCAYAHDAAGLIDFENPAAWNPNSLVRYETRTGVIGPRHRMYRRSR